MGKLPPYFLPGESSRRCASGGIRSRSSAVVAGPSARAASTSSVIRVSQASPSLSRPLLTTSLASRVRSRVATRSEALPHTAGSSARGKAKRVRRMASCLTTLRSS